MSMSGHVAESETEKMLSTVDIGLSHCYIDSG